MKSAGNTVNEMVPDRRLARARFSNEVESARPGCLR